MITIIINPKRYVVTIGEAKSNELILMRDVVVGDHTVRINDDPFFVTIKDGINILYVNDDITTYRIGNHDIFNKLIVTNIGSTVTIDYKSIAHGEVRVYTDYVTYAGVSYINGLLIINDNEVYPINCVSM